MGKVNYTVSSLFGGENKLPVVSEDAGYVQRIFDHRLDRELYEELKLRNAALGVTDNFRKVIDYFKDCARRDSRGLPGGVQPGK